MNKLNSKIKTTRKLIRPENRRTNYLRSVVLQQTNGSHVIFAFISQKNATVVTSRIFEKHVYWIILRQIEPGLQLKTPFHNAQLRIVSYRAENGRISRCFSCECKERLSMKIEFFHFSFRWWILVFRAICCVFRRAKVTIGLKIWSSSARITRQKPIVCSQS